jgi:hypothetical protein
MVLNSPSFYNFFSWVEAKEFEVASDAFATFKVRSTPGERLGVESLLPSSRSHPHGHLSSQQHFGTVT